MSICEEAKVMIHDQDIPMYLWEEESNTVVYFQNKSLHHILGENTSKEAFIGLNPEISHFRIFGFPMYNHVSMEKILKMETYGKKGTCVGYNETSKDFCIYVPSHKHIEVSRDITFMRR